MTRSTPAWFDRAGPPLDLSLPVPAEADVVVVGLGASGLAAVGHAAARGAQVVGLDAVGVAAGAAGANGGFLLAGLAAFHHDAEERYGAARARRAYAWTLDLLDVTFDEEPTARRVGSLRLAADEAERRDIARHLEALRAAGFPAESYDGPEGVGLLVPTDGVVHPVDRCRRLATEAVDAGATLHAPAAVAAARPDGVVLVDGTRIRARHVVVAVDGGLERLVADVGVRTARLQMLATEPALPVTRTRPEYRRWGYDYVQQLPTGEVLLGGGRDIEGDASWGAPPTTTPEVQAHLDAELARLGVDAPVTHRWAAHAGFTDDLLPVVAAVQGTYVVGGYSGHGNLLGPALARLAVGAVLDGAPLRTPLDAADET